MKPKKKKELESVKLEVAVVNKVRGVKKRSGVSISFFIQEAIEEKLERQTTKSK